MRRESDRLRQAERDLAHATVSLEHGDHEWACYAAYQASEKAAKALLQSFGVDAWGHSVTFLLSEAKKDIALPEHLVELAKALDRHYVPARYPHAHPQGAPMDFYTAKDATAAIQASGEVVQYVRGRLSAHEHPPGDAGP
ncbi:MAG: HEPN domain-containing protein [Bacillota bacterium]|nr:HEPN domain-containing protein [Bacillota bacterium]